MSTLRAWVDPAIHERHPDYATAVVVAAGLRNGTANDGANQTDMTPASAANGGPIFGLIPRDVGNAPLTVGDAGFDTPACPASP